MEVFTLILALAESVVIVGLVIGLLKQRWALSNHVKKLKRTLMALKEALEHQIEKVGNH